MGIRFYRRSEGRRQVTEQHHALGPSGRQETFSASLLPEVGTAGQLRVPELGLPERRPRGCFRPPTPWPKVPQVLEDVEAKVPEGGQEAGHVQGVQGALRILNRVEDSVDRGRHRHIASGSRDFRGLGDKGGRFPFACVVDVLVAST